ncbi:efflux RND transporter periplasmic adaptor subunit [Desulfococcus multivorans]|uniref:Efflux transporter, RND family, MFP subunit n=1 Tax=Desulfococcus multivorans DSM 2059 TaxID=1121405 RepID=S7TZN6_DESML|nr:efflux RND transporter periplasmic adaptor subunit [Desulfococcus multivorans]AQV00704.1 MexE family multidrug efflux RND transporter periplasmic adaptor subunit [Desulfococcus multivorans]EPR42552.1 efflux transporter, RND family, MFP subunit [Desulfococcus multivorans DSM 2059]SKA18844.1 membrane fusion protein, multidrug efflux system [Desulfococcus multivorans DSM 2059]
MKKEHLLMLMLITVVTMLSGVGHGGVKETKAVTAAAPPEVEVTDVFEKAVPTSREYVAATDGMMNATILAQVQGYLIKQNYQEGRFVKKGTLLFEIDPRPFEASLDVARAVLARHQAVLTTARSTLKRILPLAEARAVSQKDKDDATGRVQAAEAEVLAARAEVRKAELQLSFTKIKSPIDGIAGAAKAQIGDLVGTPQSQELTTVSTVDPIKVYVPISEREYLQTMEHAGTRKHAPGKTGFDLILTDGTIWPHKGTLGFADRQVDPRTGAIRVAILFPNPENILRPGQYARVRALLETEKAAMVVPQRAVSELQGTYRVAVVDADNTVKIRSVKVGRRSDAFWIIEEGLKPGERVVVEGIQKVKDGIKVTPLPYSAEP